MNEIGAKPNDLLELIFHNPSGTPLSLDIAVIGRLVSYLDGVAASAAELVASPPVRPLRLIDVERGSLRFQLHLDLDYASSHSAAPGEWTGKSKLTLASEIAGLIGLFLALASPSSPQLIGKVRDDSQLFGLLQDARRMGPVRIGDGLAVDKIALDASRAGAETVILRYRELDVVLAGAGGLGHGVIASQSTHRLEPDLRVAPSVQRGTVMLTSTEPIEVSFKGAQRTAYLANLQTGKETPYQVIAIWQPSARPESGWNEVRYVAVDPEEVRPILPNTSYQALDGAIIVHQVRSWN